MQKISLQHLKELASAHGQITEAEDSFQYSDFVKLYASTMKSLADSRDYDTGEAIEESYYRLTDGWIKDHCPPVVYISEGSSRTAFACSGGKCLKLAKNSKGVAQNEAEYGNVGIGEGGYACFTMNYAYDEEYKGSILTECCAEFDKDLTKSLFKLKHNNTFIGMLEDYVFPWLKECDFNLDTTIRRFENGANRVKYYPIKQYNEAVGFLKEVKKSALPQYRVFGSLIQFYVDHGRTDDDLLTDDICSDQNWGMAIREGKIVPVILDAGFSENVYQNY